jgi:hypothetical protein
MRSSAGATAEVTDGAGAPLADADGSGTISNPAEDVLLRAPLVMQSRGQ